MAPTRAHQTTEVQSDAAARPLPARDPTLHGGGLRV